MSPLSLRRYRAERLLRQQFAALRARVLASVRARLASSAAELDEGDLEACYAQAWHGLYAAMVEGRQIANPAGWLTVVTYRRAIEEQRGRRRVGQLAPASDHDEWIEAAAASGGAHAVCSVDDLAAELDRRMRVRHLFEALRLHLRGRELQAAALCYLQGLTRAEAATEMGVSEARLRKLMDGAGAGRPGVAAKISRLAQSIGEEQWCQQQGSLMRGLAFGLLAPGGTRYQLARSHSDACPACRAYVRSLRGIAVLLPPPLVPGLRWVLDGTRLPQSLPGAAGAGAHAARAFGSGACRGDAAGQFGAVPASASAGAGAGACGAGGGWLLAGGPAAKLAVGCVLALGLGAGCVSLGPHGSAGRARRNGAHLASHARKMHIATAGAVLSAARESAPALGRPAVSPARPVASASALAPARRAGREFGPERALAAGASSPQSAPASTPEKPAARATAATAGEFSAAGSSAPPATTASSPQAGAAGSASAAQHEFAPG